MKGTHTTMAQDPAARRPIMFSLQDNLENPILLIPRILWTDKGLNTNPGPFLRRIIFPTFEVAQALPSIKQALPNIKIQKNETRT